MKIKHCYFKRSIEKKVNDNKILGFLLTNNNGDYLSLSDFPLSRYQGWFFSSFKPDKKKLFKIIENIELKNPVPISEITNYFWKIERKRGEIIENFFLPPYYHSLVYELNKPVEIELFLDFKESYDNQEWERYYQISKEKGIIVIKCQNKEDLFYLALKPNLLDYSKIEEWSLRYYQLDEERNSVPFKRYVYRTLKIKAQKIVFSVGFEKKKVLQEVREVFKNTEKLKRNSQVEIRKLFRKSEKIINQKNISEEIKMAYLCVQKSLKSLIVVHNNLVGLYAGLPWFFQFWSRDEAICLKSLKEIDPLITKKIIFNLLEKIKENGKMINVIFREIYYFPPETIDATGWFFQRIGEFVKKGFFKKDEIKKITQVLERTIEGLIKYSSKDGLIIENPKESWMDNLRREGARIEIEALILNLYHLAYQLTKKKKYFLLEKNLKKVVRQKFWKRDVLIDGDEDFTIRPNLFLTSYLYPQLLTKQEWIKCFKKSLSKLWLKWGGLSTIDQKSPDFKPKDKGEHSLAYHNGDSWFWVNNLSALVFYRIDKNGFKRYFKKILKTNTQEILWMGLIGHHAELSSANDFKSEGCWVQSWSNALYFELISEIIQSL